MTSPTTPPELGSWLEGSDADILRLVTNIAGAIEPSHIEKLLALKAKMIECLSGNIHDRIASIFLMRQGASGPLALIVLHKLEEYRDCILEGAIRQLQLEEISVKPFIWNDCGAYRGCLEHNCGVRVVLERLLASSAMQGPA